MLPRLGAIARMRPAPGTSAKVGRQAKWRREKIATSLTAHPKEEKDATWSVGHHRHPNEIRRATGAADAGPKTDRATVVVRETLAEKTVGAPISDIRNPGKAHSQVVHREVPPAGIPECHFRQDTIAANMTGSIQRFRS